jgi:hypothetical protein
MKFASPPLAKTVPRIFWKSENFFKNSEYLFAILYRIYYINTMMKKPPISSLLHLILIVNLNIGTLFLCLSCINPIFYISEINIGGIPIPPGEPPPPSEPGKTPGGSEEGQGELTVLQLDLTDKADILANSVATPLIWYIGDRVSKPTLELPPITVAAVPSWKWTYDDEVLDYAKTGTLELKLNDWLTDGVHFARAYAGDHIVGLEIVVNGKTYNGKVPIMIKSGSEPKP